MFETNVIQSVPIDIRLRIANKTGEFGCIRNVCFYLISNFYFYSSFNKNLNISIDFVFSSSRNEIRTQYRFCFVIRLKAVIDSVETTI